jgi:hypothetical protein
MKSYKFKEANAKYPWDLWSDGRIHKLTRGRDFHAKTTVLRCLVYAKAQKQGRFVHTSMPEPDVLVIQFYA